MLKGKDIFTFVRFGGLSIKKQKGFEKGDWKSSYHSPPAPRGFYSMPKIAQEFFLLGSLSKTQPGIFAKEENVTKAKEDNEDYWRDKLRQIRKEFRKTNGFVWHHLEEYIDPKEIVDRHGTWVKSDMKSWSIAFSRMSTILRFGREKYDLDNGITSPGIGKGVLGFYSKDHCEVFFDEKV
jgi:hypothetical protein